MCRIAHICSRLACAIVLGDSKPVLRSIGDGGQLLGISGSSCSETSPNLHTRPPVAVLRPAKPSGIAAMFRLALACLVLGLAACSTMPQTAGNGCFRTANRHVKCSPAPVLAAR